MALAASKAKEANGQTHFFPIVQVLHESVDSGTESDDEIEEDVFSNHNVGKDEDDDPEVTAATSGMDSRPSSTPVGAMRALGLHESEKENIRPNSRNNGFREYIRPDSTIYHIDSEIATVSEDHEHPVSHGDDHPLPPPHDSDDFFGLDGNHSSEEELEEINKFDDMMEAATPPVVTASSTASAAVSAVTPLTASIPATAQSTALTNHISWARATPICDTPDSNCSMSSSGDEHGTGCATPMDYHPVQFSMSPPTGVHVQRPRRSSSPPAKMILLREQENKEQEGQDLFAHPHTLYNTEDSVGGNNAAAAPSPSSPFNQQRLNGVERNNAVGTGGGAVGVGGSNGGSGSSGGGSGSRRYVSPRKRFRQTRGHGSAGQRPCLDFEKMQQLKTRAVTNWRHGGGELSLFCW